MIDKKGSQKKIGDQFTKLYKEVNDNVGDLQYVWFDFHGECKKMKWENLSKLVDIVQEQLKSNGHFTAEITSTPGNSFYSSETVKILTTQTGTFRTNCMDCLDRTNVVQGVFSRYVAHEQL